MVVFFRAVLAEIRVASQRTKPRKSIPLDRWQGIVSIFVHLPMPLRPDVHRRAVAALAPGGILLMEAYGPDQIALGTGGPKEPERLCPLKDLQEDFEGLEWLVVRESRRDVQEWKYHHGLGAVIQILGRKG